jgi:hypothetical protein
LIYWGRWPILFQFAIDLDSTDIERLQFCEGYVTPFGAFSVVVENYVAEEDVVAVVLGNVPVTATDEEMQVDELVFNGEVFGFVKAGNTGKAFLGWFIPHGMSPHIVEIIRQIPITSICKMLKRK